MLTIYKIQKKIRIIEKNKKYATKKVYIYIYKQEDDRKTKN